MTRRFFLSLSSAVVVGSVFARPAAAAAFEVRTVDFLSGDDRIAGSLYLPTGRHGAGPAVLVEGPQTNHRDMVPAIYAERLARSGLVALTFDHRTFGESGGAVRDLEHPAMKVEDIRNALAFLRTRPEVDPRAIGLLGICSGAGYAASAAAFTADLGALVTIAGFYHDPAVFRTWLGASYDARVALGQAARVRYETTGQVDYMTNVSTDPTEELAMPGQEAFDYYGTARNRGARWVNRTATMFLEPFLQFNSIDSAARITAPTLVIHSDAALVPAGARRFHASLPGGKALHWMNTREHIDFYDVVPVVAQAATQAVAWFAKSLRRTAA